MENVSIYVYMLVEASTAFWLYSIMSKLQPTLLYFTIYNPTLKAARASTSELENEDAEERAHILFYTSRDRAVSQHRMLRQVGLAKAINNFSQYVGFVYSVGSLP